jgi:hypothetical protein
MNRSLLLALVTLLVLVALAPLTAHAQPSAADAAALRATALDYVMGWYTGDADRMARALHPDLAKRDVTYDSTGAPVLRHMTAEMLIEGTRRGWGTDTPEDERRADVTILDVFGNTASVRADMRDWIDYLHLAQWNGEWKIVNVLWELRSGPDGAAAR